MIKHSLLFILIGFSLHAADCVESIKNHGIKVIEAYTCSDTDLVTVKHHYTKFTRQFFPKLSKKTVKYKTNETHCLVKYKNGDLRLNGIHLSLNGQTSEYKYSQHSGNQDVNMIYDWSFLKREFNQKTIKNVNKSNKLNHLQINFDQYGQMLKIKKLEREASFFIDELSGFHSVESSSEYNCRKLERDEVQTAIKFDSNKKEELSVSEVIDMGLSIYPEVVNAQPDTPTNILYDNRHQFVEIDNMIFTCQSGYRAQYHIPTSNPNALYEGESYNSPAGTRILCIGENLSKLMFNYHFENLNVTTENKKSLRPGEWLYLYGANQYGMAYAPHLYVKAEMKPGQAIKRVVHTSICLPGIATVLPTPKIVNESSLFEGEEYRNYYANDFRLQRTKHNIGENISTQTYLQPIRVLFPGEKHTNQGDKIISVCN